VRSYVPQVLEIRSAWHAGQGGAADPLSTIERRANEMGGIVLKTHRRNGSPD
jgi:hypothetical protein